jgi:hypothetical protein
VPRVTRPPETCRHGCRPEDCYQCSPPAPRPPGEPRGVHGPGRAPQAAQDGAGQANGDAGGSEATPAPRRRPGGPPRLRQAILDVLAERGPLSLADLGAAIGRPAVPCGTRRYLMIPGDVNLRLREMEVAKLVIRTGKGLTAMVRLPSLPLGAALDRLATGLSEWSQATFGTDRERGPLGALKHLAKEAAEAQANPEDVTEYADCLILVLDAARRAGFDVRRLVQAAAEKLEVNKARRWPKPTSDEPVEHVREGQP